MSAVRQAINDLNRRLVDAEAIGQALDLAAGESAPSWVQVYRDQVERITEAAEAVELAINRQSEAA